jgi:hypothetical protein
LVVENKTAWFAFPVKEANGEGTKSPKLWFYEFAKEEDSPPLFTKREKSNEGTSHGGNNQAQDNIEQEPAVTGGCPSGASASSTCLHKRTAHDRGNDKKRKKTRRSKRRAGKGVEMQLGAELMEALDGLL